MTNQRNNLFKGLVALGVQLKMKTFEKVCSVLPAGLMQETDSIITVPSTVEFKLSLNCQVHQKKIKNI